MYSRVDTATVLQNGKIKGERWLNNRRWSRRRLDRQASVARAEDGGVGCGVAERGKGGDGPAGRPTFKQASRRSSLLACSGRCRPRSLFSRLRLLRSASLFSAFVPGQVRCLGLTSLNITKMISDKAFVPTQGPAAI